MNVDAKISYDRKKARKEMVEDISSDDLNESIPSLNDSTDVEEFPNMSDRPKVDAECIFCSGRFTADVKGEIWIQCLRCNLWAHELCADTERGDCYICDFCR